NIPGGTLKEIHAAGGWLTNRIGEGCSGVVCKGSKMKFAVNRYNIDFHVVLDDLPPLPEARLETHPFGHPPFEMRPIWTVEIGTLEQLLSIVRGGGTILDVSESAYWSGDSLKDPGVRLFGIALIDHPTRGIDPRDQPVRLDSQRGVGSKKSRRN